MVRGFAYLGRGRRLVQPPLPVLAADFNTIDPLIGAVGRPRMRSDLHSVNPAASWT